MGAWALARAARGVSMHGVVTWGNRTAGAVAASAWAARRWHGNGAVGGDVGAPWRILFFGTDDVSIATLERVLEAGESLSSHIEVVCPPDVGRGRRTTPVPLKTFAQQHGLTVHDAPPRTLRRWEPPTGFDIGVVVSFGYLIPARVLETMRVGAVNMHPSLLPRHRGPAPIHHTLLAGDTRTGVSVQELHPTRFDAGRVLRCEETDVAPGETYGRLRTRLAAMGGACVVRVLRDWAAHQAAAVTQDEAAATHAPKVASTDGHVAWARVTAAQLSTLSRAFGDNVGVRSQLQLPGGREVQCRVGPVCTLRADVLARVEGAGETSGTLVFDRRTKQLCVRCTDAWVGVASLHVAGDKAPKGGAQVANEYGLRDAPGMLVDVRAA